jgi:serine/threonine protein phosphatase PrpC
MRIEILGLDLKWKTVSSQHSNYLAHCIVDGIPGDPSCGIYAVFDGHGGKQVSEYCAERFPAEMRKELQKGHIDLCKPITELFAKVTFFHDKLTSFV